MSLVPRISIVTSIYKGEAYLPGFFANVTAQTVFGDCELILIHNQPNYEEIKILEAFQKLYRERVRYEKIDKLEPLSVSWNRGWRLSRGEYITFWNIDDRRPPASLEAQVCALSQNPHCCMAYGDFITSPKPGGPEGWLSVTPEFERRKFLRRMVMGGAFMTFRRDIVGRAGWFDEQFHSAMDFDFYLRLLHMSECFCRAPGLIGYFTDTQQGLSTRQGGRLSHIEMNVVQMRYGIHDKVKWELIRESNRYRVDHYFFDGEWHPITNWVADYGKPLLPWPLLWMSALVRNVLRLGMMKVGLWESFLRQKDRLLRRGRKA